MSTSARTTRHPNEDRISAETFESDRLAHRLELLEESIAEGERTLRGFVDPRSGEVVPPARGGHREQVLSNLAVERALAERIRRADPLRT
ncbi:hypothetical protein GSU68_08725 [Rathayibacter sp. VKM Ac-2759]|uniref:hypothetical protein n=1 Tax=Rathayibacter sp. VKM Ac-2759 TaxID=2609252 RepID=UPI0013197383|nr:hypothetical protein [Rathayibacter sp. VKM Ac-2759]QHC66645.1 hypothetical protein GSU68_08725 [Rathayibacter sp. VKM Ac-2759]